MNTDQSISAALLQENRNPNISDSPPWARTWTKCSCKKRLDLSVTRCRKHEPDTILVLDILPTASKCRQSVGSHWTTSVCHSVLQHELSCITLAGEIMRASTADKCAETTKEQCNRIAHNY